MVNGLIALHALHQDQTRAHWLVRVACNGLNGSRYDALINSRLQMGFDKRTDLGESADLDFAIVQIASGTNTIRSVILPGI